MKYRLEEDVDFVQYLDKPPHLAPFDDYVKKYPYASHSIKNLKILWAEQLGYWNMSKMV
jgi:hypothetical protein